jgi:hypothetical protein
VEHYKVVFSGVLATKMDPCSTREVTLNDQVAWGSFFGVWGFVFSCMMILACANPQSALFGVQFWA